jgi:hypothetical protein
MWLLPDKWPSKRIRELLKRKNVKKPNAQIIRKKVRPNPIKGKIQELQRKVEKFWEKELEGNGIVIQKRVMFPVILNRLKTRTEMVQINLQSLNLKIAVVRMRKK